MKNNEEIRRYVFAQFLERNYNLYFSPVNESFCLERDGVVGSAIIIKTTKASSDRTILDLRNHSKKGFIFKSHTYIVGINADTLELWLIPVDDIADNRTILLNNKKSCYLLLEHHPSSSDASITEKSLRETVSATLEKLKEKELLLENEDKQEKAINDILEQNFGD